jgi:hypothetical protein
MISLFLCVIGSIMMLSGWMFGQGGVVIFGTFGLTLFCLGAMLHPSNI